MAAKDEQKWGRGGGDIGGGDGGPGGSQGGDAEGAVGDVVVAPFEGGGGSNESKR